MPSAREKRPTTKFFFAKRAVIKHKYHTWFMYIQFIFVMNIDTLKEDFEHN